MLRLPPTFAAAPPRRRRRVAGGARGRARPGRAGAARVGGVWWTTGRRPERRQAKPAARCSSSTVEAISALATAWRAVETKSADAGVFGGLRRERVEVHAVDTRTGVRAGQLSVVYPLVPSSRSMRSSSPMPTRGGATIAWSTVDLERLASAAEHVRYRGDRALDRARRPDAWRHCPLGAADRRAAASPASAPVTPRERATGSRLGRSTPWTSTGAPAIVTGGASGLGEATVAGRWPRAPRSRSSTCRTTRARPWPSEVGGVYLRADVTDADQVQAAVTAAPTSARCGCWSTAPASAGRSAPSTKG